jgi:DNA-binding NarL/FixJ family response regulator
VRDVDLQAADRDRLMSGAQHAVTTNDGSVIHPTERIRVVVADDSYLIRESLTVMLAAEPEVELVAVVSDGKELEACVAAERPAVAVVDIRMPPSGTDEGVRVANRLRASHPDTGVLVLSQYAEAAYALALLESGSARRAYLL